MAERQFHSGNFGEPHDTARELLATIQTHSGLRRTLIKGVDEPIGNAVVRLRAERRERRGFNTSEGTTIYYGSPWMLEIQYQYLMFFMRKMFGKRENINK